MKDKMKLVFRTVHVMKPDSSRKESVELYFIGMHKKSAAKRSDVFPSAVPDRSGKDSQIEPEATTKVET